MWALPNLIKLLNLLTGPDAADADGQMTKGFRTTNCREPERQRAVGSAHLKYASEQKIYKIKIAIKRGKYAQSVEMRTDSFELKLLTKQILSGPFLMPQSPPWANMPRISVKFM